MEDSEDKDLRAKLLKMAMTRDPPSVLIPQKELDQLINQEKIPVYQLFKARYPDIVLSNVTNRQVFFQMIKELENMIRVKQGLTIKRKKIRDNMRSDEIFINNFVDLLFTEDEKEILYQVMSDSWPEDRKKQEKWESQEQQKKYKSQIGQQTFSYILKNLFLTEKSTKTSAPSSSVDPDLDLDF